MVIGGQIIIQQALQKNPNDPNIALGYLIGFILSVICISWLYRDEIVMKIKSIYKWILHES